MADGFMSYAQWAAAFCVAVFLCLRHLLIRNEKYNHLLIDEILLNVYCDSKKSIWQHGLNGVSFGMCGVAVFSFGIR